MVKRILALSLLMVGLVACGSGGGASAEADTINTVGASSCNCSVGMYNTRTREQYLTTTRRVSTPLCDESDEYKSNTCDHDEQELCTLIQPNWYTALGNGSDCGEGGSGDECFAWEPRVWCKN